MKFACSCVSFVAGFSSHFFFLFRSGRNKSRDVTTDKHLFLPTNVEKHWKVFFSHFYLKNKKYLKLNTCLAQQGHLSVIECSMRHFLAVHSCVPFAAYQSVHSYTFCNLTSTDRIKSEFISWYIRLLIYNMLAYNLIQKHVNC
jgi:hypothetical protein